MKKPPEQSINLTEWFKSQEYQDSIIEKIADKVVKGEVKLEVLSEEDKL